MSFIIEFCQAVLMVAGATIAFTIATICAYIVAVAIQSHIEESRKKKGKK